MRIIERVVGTRKIHRLLVLCLLLYAIYGRCNKQQIQFEPDCWGAEILIDGVKTVGHINGSPLLQCSGEITRNFSPVAAPSFLSAILIPQGESLDEAASEMQNHQVWEADSSEEPAGSVPMDSLCALPKGGFVTYTRRISPGEEGSVKFSFFDINNDLEPGKDYLTYLAIKRGRHIFYNKEKYISYVRHARGQVPTVEISKSELDCSGKVPQLSMEGKISGLSKLNAPDDASCCLGFVFIKEGEDIDKGKDITPKLTKVLASLLKEGDFSKTSVSPFILYQGRDVVIYRCSPPIEEDGPFTVKENIKEGVLASQDNYDVYGIYPIGESGSFCLGSTLKPIDRLYVKKKEVKKDIQEKLKGLIEGLPEEARSAIDNDLRSKAAEASIKSLDEAIEMLHGGTMTRQPLEVFKGAVERGLKEYNKNGPQVNFSLQDRINSTFKDIEKVIDEA